MAEIYKNYVYNNNQFLYDEVYSIDDNVIIDYLIHFVFTDWHLLPKLSNCQDVLNHLKSKSPGFYEFYLKFINSVENGEEFFIRLNLNNLKLIQVKIENNILEFEVDDVYNYEFLYCLSLFYGLDSMHYITSYECDYKINDKKILLKFINKFYSIKKGEHEFEKLMIKFYNDDDFKNVKFESFELPFN